MSDYVLFAPTLKLFLWESNGTASLTPKSSHATRYTSKSKARAALAFRLLPETRKLFEVKDIKDVKKSSNPARKKHVTTKKGAVCPSP